MNTALTIMFWTIILGSLVAFLVAFMIFALCRILKFTSRSAENELIQANVDEENALVLAIAMKHQNSKL